MWPLHATRQRERHHSCERSMGGDMGEQVGGQVRAQGKEEGRAIAGEGWRHGIDERTGEVRVVSRQAMPLAAARQEHTDSGTEANVNRASEGSDGGGGDMSHRRLEAAVALRALHAPRVDVAVERRLPRSTQQRGVTTSALQRHVRARK
jgi:hypothetical protein